MLLKQSPRALQSPMKVFFSPRRQITVPFAGIILHEIACVEFSNITSFSLLQFAICTPGQEMIFTNYLLHATVRMNLVNLIHKQ